MSSQSLKMITDFLYLFDITFVEEVPDRLKCLICKQILKNAQQTSCGCRMCEGCLLDLLGEDEQPCPGCKVDMLELGRDINRDRAANKEIATLMVECPFKTCVVTDQLRDMLCHVQVCEHREMFCVNCSSKYDFKEKVTDNKSECQERLVKCSFCRDSMTALCLKSFKKSVTEKLLIKIHPKTNLNQRLECFFNNCQCSVEKVAKEKLKEHSNEEMILHFAKLVTEFKEIKQENQILSKEMVTFKKLLTEQMNITKKLIESQIKIERSVNDLKKKSLRTSLISEQNEIFRNGSFVWKITDFGKLITDAESGERESITSDHFYTTDFGYKMCLRIYPNGGGNYQGSHLSVFFAIMKGDFDDLLLWPFKQKVTVTLLDQENNGAKNNYKKFKSRGCSSKMLVCYQRPVDNFNVASGFPDFISRVKLFQPKYYRNNTIFLKISIKGTL